jgi:uncharacterized protein (DUF362 family)
VRSILALQRRLVSVWVCFRKSWGGRAHFEAALPILIPGAKLPGLKSDVPFEPRVAAFRGPLSYRDGEVEETVRAAIEALDLPEDFVRRGDHVVLKPNWVKEHDERTPGPGAWEHIITHPTVIDAVARWSAQKIQGQGRITVCDAPQTDSSFAKIKEYCGLEKFVARWKKEFPQVDFQLLDLRPEEWHAVDGVTVSKTKLPGDPLGSTHVKLNEASEFVEYAGQGKLYGASYDMAETNARHSGATHEYLLCRTPMDADVLINLPKLKTHKKVGLTCALKNLVGINANKNWLPHHTEGTPADGGDQFPHATTKARLEHSWMGRAKRWLKDKPTVSRLFVPLKKAGRIYFGDTQKTVRSGNWHGNDTCWRMVLDLNKAFFFFEGSGARRKKPIRYLAIVDGIIAGEGNGPMSPDPKPCGIILAGTDPVAVDVVAATKMGFDWTKIRLLKNAFTMRELNFVSFKPEDIRIYGGHPVCYDRVAEIGDSFFFKPHFGWKGAIEDGAEPWTA